MIYSGKTHIGKVRTTNQDSFAIKQVSDDLLIAVVCDGMGGARGGNIASETAIEHFLSSLAKCGITADNPRRADAVPAALAGAVFEANEAVYNKSISNPEYNGMGTTLVACIITGTTVYIANIGDSRLYIDTQKKLTQISEDHSYVQFLIDVGDITPEEAKHHPYRNRITRAVGIQPETESDFFTLDLNKYPGGKILLCSDGLCGQVDSKVIHKILNSSRRKNESEDEHMNRICDKLVEAALNAGGPDNITAVVISAN